MSLALFGVFILPTAALHAQTCLASSPTTAPTCNVPLNAVATVSHLLQLTVAGGAQTNLASPTAATYDSSAAAGSSPAQYPVGANPGPTVTVKANRGWQLTVGAGNSGYWNFTPDATYQMCRPLGGTYPTCSGSSNNTAGKLSTDLAWSIDPNNAFAGLATTASTIVSNSTGSTATFTLYYRVKWLYASDVPGTYSLPVVFTVTGQ
jgi:hypothetical protein